MGRAGGGTGRPGTECATGETAGEAGSAGGGPAGAAGAAGVEGADGIIRATGTEGTERDAGTNGVCLASMGSLGGAKGAVRPVTGAPGVAAGRVPTGGWIGLPRPSNGGRRGSARGLLSSSFCSGAGACCKPSPLAVLPPPASPGRVAPDAAAMVSEPGGGTADSPPPRGLRGDEVGDGVSVSSDHSSSRSAIAAPELLR
jgi:hypothetical protein